MLLWIWTALAITPAELAVAAEGAARASPCDPRGHQRWLRLGVAHDLTT